MWAVEKQYYEMPELVGFQTMVILDPNGMTFDTVGVFGLVFWLLSKSGLLPCFESTEDWAQQCFKINGFITIIFAWKGLKISQFDNFYHRLYFFTFIFENKFTLYVFTSLSLHLEQFFSSAP